MHYHGKLMDGKAIKIVVENRKIASLSPLDTKELNSLPCIAPGLIDIQVNGFTGIDYNALPLTIDGVKESMQSLFKEGVTSFLPTIITNNKKIISEILENFEKIRDRNNAFADAVPGYHIEGPFISKEDGPRGAHNKNFVRPPSEEFVKSWQKSSRNKIKIVTMAPEGEGSVPFIKHCVKDGIRIAIGHTAASMNQISEAVSAGADLSTHLGNGCHQKLDRHDNYIWQQLSEDDLWASIIGDGFHLPPAVLKVFLKVKKNKIILISDSTSFGGLAPGKYKTHIGGEIVLTKNGKLHLVSNEKMLAGSAKSILFGVNHLVKADLLPLVKAWETASLNPARYLSLINRGRLSVGNRADIVFLEELDKEFAPIMTVMNGKVVYKK